MTTLTPNQTQSLKVNDLLTAILLMRIDVADHAQQHTTSKELYALADTDGTFSTETIATQTYATKLAKREAWQLYNKFCEYYRGIFNNKSHAKHSGMKGKLAVSLSQFEYDDEVDGLMQDALTNKVVDATYTYQKKDESGELMFENGEPVMETENILDRIIRQAYFDWLLTQPEKLPASTYTPE